MPPASRTKTSAAQGSRADVVGGEAEAGEGEKDDDRRQWAAQAEREKRGRAHRRVDHQRQQQPQARVAGDVEREDVAGVGDRPGPDLAGVEGEVRPAAVRLTAGAGTSARASR